MAIGQGTAGGGADGYLLSVTRVHSRTAYGGLVVARGFRVLAGELARAPGLVRASLRREDIRTFWTLSVWRAIGPMAGFRNRNPHRTWMGNVEALCDESAYRRLAWPTPDLPAWAEAEGLLRAEAHFTAMARVSANQAACRIPARRLGRVRTLDGPDAPPSPAASF